MPDADSNTKTCLRCHGRMCWFNATMIEIAHWHCMDCGAIEIITEEAE